MEHVTDIQSEIVELLLQMVLDERKYSSALINDFVQKLQAVLDKHDSPSQNKSVLRKDLKRLIAEIKAVHTDLLTTDLLATDLLATDLLD